MSTHTALSTIAVLICIAISAFDVHPSYAVGNVVRVETIDFRGLNYLSKYEIIQNVPVKLEEDTIIVDVDALETALSMSRMIKSFRVVEKEGKLVVYVVENKPAFLVALKKGSRLIPFELDDGLNILSAGTVHADDIPLVVVSEKDIIQSRFSERILRVFQVIRYLRSNDVPLLSEITEIDCTHMNFIQVKVNGRRTVFTCHSKTRHFMTINYILGHLDSKGSYPDKILVDDRMAASW
ncbi:MAG: cell division protein FtsQ/DivIB [Spirochaetota bacterium]